MKCAKVIPIFKASDPSKSENYRPLSLFLKDIGKFYKIRGLARKWIINYLSDRTQYVKFLKHISTLCSIDCGVPQGSILGPLLYLIYVNDVALATDSKLFRLQMIHPCVCLIQIQVHFSKLQILK